MINGATLLLLGKEIIQVHKSDSTWKNLYDACYTENLNLKEETRVLREAAATYHNDFMALSSQVQNQESRLIELVRKYNDLLLTVEEMGGSVDPETGNVSFELEEGDIGSEEEDSES